MPELLPAPPTDAPAPEGDAVRAAALASASTGDPTGWFDGVYAGASGDAAAVPWAAGRPNPHYAEWAEKYLPAGHGKSALVVGCGLGDDAEDLASRGYDTTAFDVSPEAVAWCRRRFPASAVRYRAADLFDHPAAWHRAFDFVLEVFTVQSLPTSLRGRAVRHVADCVRPGGTALVIARARDADDAEPSGPPWPLCRAEVRSFEKHGLCAGSFDDLPPLSPGSDDGLAGSRHWRASFTRPLG